MMRVIKSAERTVALFEFFSRHQCPLTVGKIAEGIAVPQPSVSMLLANLNELGYLSYNRVERTYTPTIRVALLGSWIAQQFDEVGSMSARLKGLQDDVDETVFMGIQNGPYGQYVLALPKESSRSMRALSGQMKLLTMSATGRVLLSLKPDGEVSRWVHRCNAEAERPDLQIATSEFINIITKIRALGFAETQGDVTPSFGAFAVSVSLPTGIMPIAVGVGVPIDQMDSKRDSVVAALQRVKEAFEK
jgi:IclR family transcriptional regulator, KDG regulon repressor